MVAIDILTAALAEIDPEVGDILVAVTAATAVVRRRLGVTVALGGRVRHEDREGTITDTAGQYLRVLLNGDTDTTVRHATASLAYQHPDSTWVEATPLPDLYAHTAHKAGQ
ncbi:hypothetical protein [Streptomyces sp. bgisy126]|uniref:hypothetical protein n=1 Tax=unclassified Streptomyces TaxID=2593676 RepID=UPI003EBE2B2F